MPLSTVKLSLSLPEIATPESQAFYKELTITLENIVEKVGKAGSSGFALRREELQRATTEENIGTLLAKPAYIRPLLDLWQHDAHFRKRIQPSPFLLGRITALVQQTRHLRLGRLAFRECLHLFFTHYSTLTYQRELGNFLQYQFSCYQSNELMFGLEKLQEKCSQVLTQQGHIAFATEAAITRYSIVDLAKYYGIAVNTSFIQASQQIYYIEALKKLRPNENTASAEQLLTEMQRDEVANARYNEDKRLGHEVLRILIDILHESDQVPNELWMNTLLGVGGDPRMQKNAVEWWNYLDDHYTNCMYSWLSAVDIKLFLKIWKEFAEQDGDKNLQRMYPPREKFLKGLIKQKNLVRSSRLFVGSKGMQRINALPKNQRPHISRIQGRDDLAIVYLNLGNGHLVEGSHSFSLAIMDKLPHASPFATTKESYSNNELISPNLKKQYEKEFGNTGFFLRRVHNGSWQQDAHIMLNRLGLRIPYDDLVDRATYMRTYR